jgi:NAD(P)H-nitrite reductase large subunit
MVVAIIGTGIAAKTAAETLLERLGAADRLVLVGDEKDRFYSRVFLPDYIAGEIQRADLFLPAEKMRGDERVRFVHAAVIDADMRRKELRFAKLAPIVYDKLIVASGSSARRLSLRNADAAGVHVLRTLEDADSIRDEAARVDHCVVVGGGLVGLKAAWALRRLGREVTVVVESERVLSRVADQATSMMLADSFQAQGTRFFYRSVVRGLEAKRGRVSAVVLENDVRIPAQLVIAAKGVRANLDFVRQSGVMTGEGVVADSLMQTSHPDVYAAGDVAEVKDCLGGGRRVFALWPHAAEQGRIAARSLLGEVRKYTGAIAMNAVVFYGRPYVFLGNAAQPVSTGCRAYSHDAGNGVHRAILVREKTLVGAILAGSIDCAGMVCWDIRSGRKIEDPQAYLTRDGLVGTSLSRAERPLSFSH